MKSIVRGVRAKKVYISKEALRPFSLSPLELHYIRLFEEIT